MADALLRIKRSGVNGNPSSLHTGELAYSWFEGEGGNRLYIGTGTETDGNAVNHVVIGGKFFTDMLDHQAGVLTASSALIVDENKKIDQIITPSITNDGDLTIEGVKTIVKNLYVDEATTLQAFVDSRVTAGQLTVDAGEGIEITGEGNTKVISLTATGVEAKDYGSATKVPVLSVDAQGRITGATEAEISTSLGVTDGTTEGTVALMSDKLSIKGESGVKVALVDQTFTATIDETAVVKTTGAQSIAGAKTFTEAPTSTVAQTRNSADAELAKMATLKAQTIYTDTSENGSTVAIGGIPKGKKYTDADVLTIINDLLHPYVAPTSVSVTLNETGGVFEKGISKSITSGTVRWTNGSQLVTKAEILQAGTPQGEALLPSSASQTAVTLTAPITVTADTSFTARVTDATKTTTGGNVAFTFVYPFHWGVVSADKTSLTGDEVKALTKVVQTKGNKNYNYTANNQKCVFAYPASYGNLSKILDANSFDVTSTFVKSQVSVTGLDGTAQTYNVYMNGASTISAFKFTFNF